MMKYLWNWIESQNWKAESKYKVLILILSLAGGIAGLILWSIVQIWILKSLDWMFCFAGYPMIISWFAICLYACNHDFHNGKPFIR